jgi:hypothetical protein
MFRVRVQTTGATLTASTLANMSGLSVFDLLGGAAGADGADGADGSDALALAGADQTIAAGVTREIVLNGSGGSIAKLNIVDGQGNILESVQAYGSGVAIQEKYGALAVRSTSVFQGSIALYEAAGNGINSISIKAPASVSSNKTFTLPDSYGTSGQMLSTDGTGTLSWASASGGGGGGMTETPLANFSGRVQWSSSYAGRRMTFGNTSYGPFNWYLHSQIVNGSAQTYSSADAVDTTTKTMANYYIYNAGLAMTTDSKKVRVKFTGRFNNAIANGSGTVGFSVWHCASMTSGSYAGSDTIRLIAKSADITPTTSSLVVWEEIFTGSTAYSGGRIMVFAEHRSGTLSATAYCYANIAIFLVD